MKKIYILINIAAFVFSLPVHAVLRMCISNGNWTNASNWTGNQAPACGDTVMICAGHVIAINNNINYPSCVSPVFIYVNGQMNFSNGKKMSLPAGSVITINVGGVINPGGGGGNSNTITIGNKVEWSDSDGPVNGFAIIPKPSPLPIKLTAFNAEVKNGTVELNWTTASEINNDYFTIQRTTDGQLFENLNTVDGAGNSTAQICYKTVDCNPYHGISYYRLLQTDNDGKSSVSGVINVDFSEKKEFSFNMFQNPGNGSSLIIEMNSELGKIIKLEINDVKGTKMFSENIVAEKSGKNLNQLVLPQKLSPGIYIINVNSDNTTLSKKYMVQ